MRITLEIEFPDDFLVSDLPINERNRVLTRRFQGAFDKEYPLAPMETVRIVALDSIKVGEVVK